MKLARCTDGGAPFWAMVDPETDAARPIVGGMADWGPAVTRGDGEAALTFGGPALTLSTLRLMAPCENTSKVVIAGANYSRHLVEFGVAPPTQPIAFLKAYGALIGAHDPIRYPPLTEQLDYECELVVVIGDETVDLDDPLASVLGYTAGNDVSARDLQRSGPPGIGMDLYAAKSQDRATPVGPWIVTKDEFPAGSPALRLSTTINGELRQDGTSADMTWDVCELIRFIQPRVSFGVGDLLFTGTPEGVGQGSGRYLNPGDRVEVMVEGVGTLNNIVGPRTLPPKA
ncbi:fumarylacetoacetate hydrolase family protein [Brevundimonas sp. AJA228-03]|uniref:fumarylacetoacetate hydrolase family protein n=1 Tax=Brevundimonas sp. AJA228-03 TaxID=2752515 RepID=UPI001ADF40A5|nr:fumarylacetoacetate hydrolase family protein [Brevundimonas sp. AJA228-03]QTN18377.1 fumarylacetoacetate hydrolase family protein [Brevundimonas sp. AJA228-03]